MSYRPGPDDTYYEDWVMSDDWRDDGVVHIDLAKVVILLWILIGSLL